MKHSAHTQAVVALVLEVLKTAPKLQVKGDKMTEDLGLTSSRWWCLVHIAEASGELTVADVARRMNLKRQTVLRFADALLDSGMIRFSANPNHKRARLLSVTDEGRKALASIEQRELDWAKRMVSKLSQNELEGAVKTLSVFRENIADQ